MSIFFKGIAASLMGVLMTGTAAQGGEIAVIETTMGNIELEFLEDQDQKGDRGYFQACAYKEVKEQCRGGSQNLQLTKKVLVHHYLLDCVFYTYLQAIEQFC